MSYEFQTFDMQPNPAVKMAVPRTTIFKIGDLVEAVMLPGVLWEIHALVRGAGSGTLGYELNYWGAKRRLSSDVGKRLRQIRFFSGGRYYEVPPYEIHEANPLLTLAIASQ